MNHLPCLYPNCDIDPQRFVWNNYFDADLTVFKPRENFRSSMILLNARDLAEDIFMSKYRLNAYVKYVLPMMRTTLGNILKPKHPKLSSLHPSVLLLAIAMRLHRNLLFQAKSHSLKAKVSTVSILPPA